MKFKNKAFYSISAIAFCLPLLASAGEPVLKDVKYNFDEAKVQAAKNSFHFLRSFVDLFYLSYKENESSLPAISKLSIERGWCVGDAHAENFGAVLLDNETSIFTMNDMDDSGHCPIGLDLYRLLVSTRLYNPQISLTKMVAAYVDGTKNTPYEMPASIQEMMTKSVEKGIKPKKSKVAKHRIVRTKLMIEVTEAERAQILEALNQFRSKLAPDFQVLDLVSTSKIGGGSGGLLRYEVLLNNGGVQLHLEFKEEVKASIYPVASSLPDTKTRIERTLKIDQGPGASRFYGVVEIGGKDMLVRPRFAGNIGVSLAKQSDASADSEDEDSSQSSDTTAIILFEAYTLGKIHTHSITNSEEWTAMVKAIQASAWEHDVDLMVEYFQKKYDQIKK